MKKRKIVTAFIIIAILFYCSYIVFTNNKSNDELISIGTIKADSLFIPTQIKDWYKNNDSSDDCILFFRKNKLINVNVFKTIYENDKLSTADKLVLSTGHSKYFPNNNKVTRVKYSDLYVCIPKSVNLSNVKSLDAEIDFTEEEMNTMNKKIKDIDKDYVLSITTDSNTETNNNDIYILKIRTNGFTGFPKQIFVDNVDIRPKYGLIASYN